MTNYTRLPDWLLRWPRFIRFGIGFLVVLLFLPWQQYSPGEGKVIGRNPNDRFQEIHAPVSGVIQRWHVSEGSMVKKGDLLITLSDTDPELIHRLREDLELSQQAFDAAQKAYETAQINLARQGRLFSQGLSARKEWEQEQIKVKKLEIEVSKARAVLLKSQNGLARQSAQEVRAPADGQILRLRSGEGGLLAKQGDTLAVLAPKDRDLAVELWISGNDIALIKLGQRALLEFAGWPAVQIAGWPSLAVGTFPAHVAMVDTVSSKSGKFRVLLVPDGEWPGDHFLRQGSYASGFISLQNVSIGRELWRKFNGLPMAGALREEDLHFIQSKDQGKDKAREESK